MIQSYRVYDYQSDMSDWDASGCIGINFLIGESSLIGKNYRSAMIKQFVIEVVKKTYPDAVGVIADPKK